MNPNKILTFSILLVVNSLFAGGPDTLWTKRYDYQLIDWANSVLKTSDGGYLLVGQTATYGEGNYLIIKTDRSGEVIWAKIYDNGYYMEEFCSVVETQDSGYLVVGYPALIMKIDANGDSLWKRTLPLDPSKIERTMDGNYIISGGYGAAYGALTKITPLGDIIWSKTWGGNGVNSCRSVKPCPDSGYILTGETYGGVWLIKTDSDGDTLWTRALGGAYGTDIELTSDGGYIIAGYDGNDAYIVKTDSNGNLLWTRRYGGPETDIVYSVDRTYDDYYVFFGETSSFGAGGYDVYVIKLNINGDTIWTKTYGDAGHDEGWFGCCTSDSGYIITGVYSPDGLNGDVFLLKTMPDITGITEDKFSESREFLSLLSNPVIDGELNFTYNLTKNQEIKITLYNILGQEVRTFFEGFSRAGFHRMREKLNIPAGIYFLKLTAGTNYTTKKLVILKPGG